MMGRTFDEGYVLERGHDDIGPLTVAFGVGSPGEFEAMCLPGLSLAALIVGEGDVRRAIIATAFDEQVAMYIPMEAQSLRNFAMGMLRMADELDGGRGKQ